MTEEVKASLGQLAGAVVKIRDEISKIQKEADKKIAKLKEDKEKIEAHLQEHCLEHDVMSVKTESGTIMCQVQRKIWTANRPAFYEWVVRNDAFDCLEKRIKQSTMNQFMEENPDEIPEGINVDAGYKIVVRRS